MAFNKNKALESALKYLNQGKIAQAISEYQQILRHEPKDQATLMTVGDLYARASDMPHAVEYFERLAQVYLSDGFNSKAIAIYKKIAKLAPNELTPLERLADLYVQQGVLSEARPLFLQIAEVHLKANRSQKAVEVLQRLLDVEPDNPRVQMRLAELYNVMGQKKEAAHTYLSYAQRLLDRNENDEALKLVDRALELDAANASALLLKGRTLASGKKTEEAVKVLSAHPEADAGGELTDFIFGLQLESGHAADCIERARKELARGNAHFGPMLRVTDSLIGLGKTGEALPLLRELREPMVEAGEQDKFLKSLTSLTERALQSIEALEMLADFCRHTSDPFRLNTALGQLADAYAEQGNFARAVELTEELADRNKGDERILDKLTHLRARAGGAPAPATASEPAPAVEPPAAAPVAIEELAPEMPVPAPERHFGETSDAPETPAAAASEPELDEETQRYVGQALTDADLFSSYGLTQKATHLLESVLERAPRHTPSLERLLDLYLGAGNERRTAEVASLLEQIYRLRGDATNADHFAEMRKRFHKAAEAGEPQLPAPPATGAPPEIQASVPAAPPEPGAPAEFEIPLAPVEKEPGPAPAAREASVKSPGFEVPLEPPPAAPVESAGIVQPQSAIEELDLSDEWEALSREVQEPEQAPSEPVAAADAPAAAHAGETSGEFDEVKQADSEEATPGETIELTDQSSEPASEPEPTPAEAEPMSAEPLTAGASNGDGPEPLVARPFAAAPPAAPKAPALTTDDFIKELVAEIEESVPAAPLEPQPPEMAEPARAQASGPPAAEVMPPAPAEPVKAPVMAVQVPPAVTRAFNPPPPPAHGQAQHPVQEPAPQVNAQVLNELADVFQEFRDELGEIENEEEDLETHYNLGIAYREMGLLDEAIGEFQRVAKAIQKGKPFPYAMNCATLMALSFLDKGEPKIAAFWYQKALETPGIDQETELALRYDLGVALETAGESKSALDSFQRVYAMNIDYRDVGDRIAALQKHAHV